MPADSAGSSPPSLTPSPTPTHSTAPEPEPEPDESITRATFTATIDGDTIDTSAGTVRIIGIDTPERGECGYDDASRLISDLVSPGDEITLELPEGQNDEDRHGRLLRYVTTGNGVDLGLSQIEAGHAVARYDSRDGYPAHPMEETYVAAQTAELDASGSVLTVACKAAAEAEAAAFVEAEAKAAAAEQAAAEQAATDAWWRQYSSCSKLKKNTVGHPKGPFNRDNPAEATIYNYFQYETGHRGDGDGDGLACE